MSNDELWNVECGIVASLRSILFVKTKSNRILSIFNRQSSRFNAFKSGVTMKSFTDLIEDVQKPGLCHRCGGCVTFCSAVNYSALELDSEGKPRYADQDKCIECGLCHTICPEVNELEEETRQRRQWRPPIGRVIEAAII